ncbi:MAG: hypothetical protein KAT27_01760 [Desulfobacterales bacterium]|nr:hypothetical protein [Desulfobacterales bacterium]
MTNSEEKMSSELIETIKPVLKAADSLRNVGNILRACDKLRGDLNRNAFVLETHVSKLDRTLSKLNDLQGLISKARGLQQELLKEASLAQERFKNSIAAELADFLRPHGLEITGNFPELKCGILTLIFSFGKGGIVKVYYGPRISLLKKVPVEPEKIGEAVISILKGLNDPPLDDEQFVKEIYVSYSSALMKEGRRDEDEQPSAVPIVGVMQEMAFLKQKRSFRTDPTREHFTSYGRVKFSYDLARLKTRRLGDRELRLGVASMQQTKSEKTSLWVPKLLQGNGTHYAFVLFV